MKPSEKLAYIGDIIEAGTLPDVQLDMSTCYESTLCGSVACIGGFVLILFDEDGNVKPQPEFKYLEKFVPHHLLVQAAKRLGVDFDPFEERTGLPSRIDGNYIFLPPGWLAMTADEGLVHLRACVTRRSRDCERAAPSARPHDVAHRHGVDHRPAAVPHPDARVTQGEKGLTFTDVHENVDETIL